MQERSTTLHDVSDTTFTPVDAESWSDRIFAWRDRLVASTAFQRWAARFPLTRPIARRRSQALFDICAGFVYTQVLRAAVELDLFAMLAEGAATPEAIAARTSLPLPALDRLLRAAIALRLLETRSRGRVGLGSLGAPLVGNEGLKALIAHHSLLYEDLRDPIELLRRRGGQDTALSRYYPYVVPHASPDTAEVAPYSALMSATAGPLIAEVLDAYSFTSHRRLLDIGGGEGRFARAVQSRWPHLSVAMYDLPAVAERARQLGARDGAAVPIEVFGGDFRSDDLPTGFDVMTVVRVLLDHDDATVVNLLTRIRAGLTPGGKLLIVEPIGARNTRTVGDAYFALYLFAMGSGRVRSERSLTDLCLQAGFRRCRRVSTHYPISTGILVAEA